MPKPQSTSFLRRPALAVAAVGLLLASPSEAALPEQGRWALGVSLRNADTSSLWRIGPRFGYGLTLGTTAFTRVNDWSLWALDLDLRLSGLIFHHRAKETAWFTFLEHGFVLREVDQETHSHGQLPHRHEPDVFGDDTYTSVIAMGSGIAWAPHKRVTCFMRWGILFQYFDLLGTIKGSDYSWPDHYRFDLDKIRLTGLWML